MWLASISGNSRGNSANNLVALAEAAAAKDAAAAAGREEKEQGGVLSTLTMGMLG